ncbi:PREDICTED: uncharacterized protein LOC105315248, partial [Amphimedon queenslandica]|uniref:Endonuclease/exonuclease/phosphatase domain-containing protein n=1 Tax=Amphimedon queenslandica TaxID=400682 RepID=A0A1X7T6P9_AMPQE
MVAIHQSIPSFQLSSPPNLEILSVQLVARGSPIICVVYVPPNSDNSYLTPLFDYLNSLLTTNWVLLLGDFNSPDICWSTLSGNTQYSRTLCDFIFRHNLNQFVDFPTHTSGHILDLIISSPETDISGLSTLSSPLKSDHHLLGFFFLLSTHISRPCDTSPRFSHNYRKADFDSISDYLLNHDFGQYYESSDIEFLWHHLQETIFSAISLFTPTISRRPHSHPPPWFTPSVRNLLNKVHFLRRRCRLRPSPTATSLLSQAEPAINKEIADARVAYESTLVEAFAFSKDSAIYRYIRSFSKCNGIPTVLQHQSELLSTAVDKAAAFNNYFHSVFNSSNTDIDVSNLPFPDKSICSISITVEDTFAVLSTLNISKSMGGDGIPPIILQKCAAAL